MTEQYSDRAIASARQLLIELGMDLIAGNYIPGTGSKLNKHIGTSNNLVRDVALHSIRDAELDKKIHDLVFNDPEFRAIVRRIMKGYESMLPGSVWPKAMEEIDSNSMS